MELRVRRISRTSYYLGMDDMVSTGSTDGDSTGIDGGAGGDSTGTDDGRARWQARYEASRVREADFTTLSGLDGRAGVRRRGLRVAGRVPVHPRAVPDRLPRPHLDDPAVRRLRQRRADQRALPDDPRPRRRRAERRLRHADPDGSRLRRPEEPRRGRPLRCRDRLRRRHGAALRPASTSGPSPPR